MISYSPHSINSTVQTFERRDFLPVAKTSLWRIESGLVRTLSFRDDGGVIPLGLWGPGQIVGHTFLGDDLSCQMECLVAVNARPMVLDQVENPYQIMIEHMQQMQAFLHIRSGPVAQRLGHFLDWLAHHFGRKKEQGYLVDLPLTHQDMADMIGTTRVTITRLMQQFEQSSIIYRTGRHGVLYFIPPQ
jgi:CRP-like cAMP-binding protein